MKVYIYILSLLAMLACNSGSEQVSETVTDNEKTFIRISRQQADQIGVKLDSLKKIPFARRIHVNGYLDTPPQNKATVCSKINGTIAQISYLPGDYVAKGREVIRLESIDFLQLQQKWLELNSQLTYMEDEYARQKELSEKNVTARKAFLKAESDLLHAQAGIKSISKQLILLNANLIEIEKGNISSTVIIKAPISGYVTRINATIGEFIHTEDALLGMVNPDHLHAEMEVFEKDAVKVRKGQSIEISIPQLEGSKIMGEVYLVGKELDEQSRSVGIHVHFPEQENLIVGMYIEGEVILDEHESYGIPTAGMIQEESGNYVFALVSAMEEFFEFEKIEVNKGLEYKGFVEITDFQESLAGRKLATDGVYFLSTVVVQ